MAFATFEEAGFEDWWRALPPGNHTILGTVKVRDNFESPELGNSRRIWLRLPSSYFDDEDKRYPVIVMHDGQNVFDEATSYKGQEWHADDTMLDLERRGLEVIVVAVENAGEGRTAEYNAFVRNSKADAYVTFLADTLLPFINDACNDRTLRNPDQTLVMGASYGAWISLYTFFTRRDVFGLCGIMSPSPRPPLLDFLRRQPHVGGRIFIGNGSSQGDLVRDVLEAIGYQSEPTRDLCFVNDDLGHEESGWSILLPQALEFLYDLPK